MRTLALVVLSAGLMASLLACGSDDRSSSSAEAPKTSTEAKSGTSYKDNPVPAPDVTLETLDGRTIDLTNQTGKVVLVNFWATWCAPCRKEIPDLINLYTELKSKGLLVVGVATDDEGRRVVAPFVERKNINYPIVVDTNRTISSQFDSMYGLPTTYVINPKGQIVRRVLGIFPVEDMKPTLERMLQEENAA